MAHYKLYGLLLMGVGLLLEMGFRAGSGPEGVGKTAIVKDTPLGLVLLAAGVLVLLIGAIITYRSDRKFAQLFRQMRSPKQ